ncbi:MAG: hypothetical protein OYG32_14105 [Rhodospirillaceae bacterium]|nr:hypothetical protein [Rhodospirillaceae bacterium]
MPKEREIFAELIEQKGEPGTVALLTLGLFHYHKWDRIVDWERQNDGQLLPVAQQHRIGDEFSPEDVRRYKQIANRTIRDLQQQALLDNLDATVARHRDTWWRGFGQSFAAALAYSILLLVLFFVVRWLGSDLAAIFGRVAG